MPLTEQQQSELTEIRGLVNKLLHGEERPVYGDLEYDGIGDDLITLLEVVKVLETDLDAEREKVRDMRFRMKQALDAVYENTQEDYEDRDGRSVYRLWDMSSITDPLDIEEETEDGLSCP